MKTNCYIRVLRLICAATIATAILAGLPPSIGAQTQAAQSAKDPGQISQELVKRAEDVAQRTPPPPPQTPEQLRQKLQQLEQTIQELKAQINLLEQAQQTVEAPAVLPSAKGQVPTPRLPTTYIGKETRDRQTANENEVSAPRIDNEQLDPALRGFFRMPGTNTLIKLGGFVKADFFYDLNFAGSYYGLYVPSTFPSTDTPHARDSTVSMRPSRFFIEFRQPAEPGDTVKGYLEWDFLGAYDRNSLRMRQFYAQYKNFLAGQTWSAFGDPDAFPDTLEFEGPPGIMGLRSPQFRYTQPINDHNWFGVSVEKSGTDIPFATQFGTPIATQGRPDLVAFYRYENNYGHIHAAGVFRDLGGIVPNSQIPDLTEHVDGYGVSLSGVWRFGRFKDNVVFQAMIGKGIANYYNDNFGLQSDVGFDANGHLVATPTGSGTVGYQHYWADHWRSTFSYGYLRINNTAADPGTNYHVSNYATANIIYQPTINTLFGAEYVYGSLRRKNDFKWVAPRFVLSVVYYLNKHPRE
jgi:hypothetical protein